MFLIFPSKKKAVEDYAPLSEGQEAHWEVTKKNYFWEMIFLKKTCRWLRGCCSYMPNLIQARAMSR